MNEKDLIILIISFPDDYNYLITALETMQKTSLGLYKTLIYEADKIKNESAGTVVKTTDTNQDALFTANKKPNTSESLDSNPKLNCTTLK